MATYPWPLIYFTTTHTSLGMAWWFVNPVRPVPIALGICGLDGGYPHVYVTSQARATFPMHIQGMCKCIVFHLWPLGPRIISHTSLRIAWRFLNPRKSSPTALVVCGLDGGHPHVCVTSKACENFPIYPQDMWYIWQPIHGHLYLTSHPTPSWGWLGGLQILSDLGPHLGWYVA